MYINWRYSYIKFFTHTLFLMNAIYLCKKYKLYICTKMTSMITLEMEVVYRLSSLDGLILYEYTPCVQDI